MERTYFEKPKTFKCEYNKRELLEGYDTKPYGC